jgi:hypothetical protein
LLAQYDIWDILAQYLFLPRRTRFKAQPAFPVGISLKKYIYIYIFVVDIVVSIRLVMTDSGGSSPLDHTLYAAHQDADLFTADHALGRLRLAESAHPDDPAYKVFLPSFPRSLALSLSPPPAARKAKFILRYIGQS